MIRLNILVLGALIATMFFQAYTTRQHTQALRANNTVKAANNLALEANTAAQLHVAAECYSDGGN